MGGPLDDPSMEERADDTMTEDDNMIIEDAGAIHAPPAHLAARFYRSAANFRRKSSAASSRRNSLSSAHSRASSVSRRSSAPGGLRMRSHSIAHQLRRASYLEDRRARLADRAAHAEVVRERCLMLKALPRGNNSASEERALAAQLAKEKYLAKVAAACAEEVAHARHVAEAVKERKRLEEEKAKREMEERHAEVEKRRAEYQRNLHERRVRRADSTTKQLAIVDEDVPGDDEIAATDGQTDPRVLSETGAACRIQRAWRLSQRSAVIKAFKTLQINSVRVRGSEFEEMTAKVANKDVISATTALLTQLGLADKGDDLSTRTFLSTYMVTAHPVAVLNSRNGAQELDLIEKAQAVVDGFEHALTKLTARNNYNISSIELESLSQCYSDYTSAFAAWRLQDSSVLVEGMLASFVELDAIWQTVKDDSRGEVANDFRQGIRDNQVKLLSRIQKLAGRDAADIMIKRAIRESRRRRPKKRAVAEVRPRGLEAGGQAAVLAHASDSEGDSSDSIIDISPPQVSGELGRLFAPMPSNRVLTHELAINKDYRLEEDESNAGIREHIYRSICDSMRQAFAAGQGAVWTISAAENIREKLLRMLKPGNSMYTLINDTLNSEQIGQQCEQGGFSYDGFFSFMANLLPKLCAPFRDQEVKLLVDQLRGDALVDSGDFDELSIMIEKLFRLLQTVDTLSLDYSNFMIMQAAPTLIREAPGYESRLFGKDVESGAVSVDHVRQLWRNAEDQLLAEAERRDPDNVRRPEDRPTSTQIYTKALVDLAIAQQPLTIDDVPETLLLDHQRLQSIRERTLCIAVIGAIFLTAKNLLKRDVRSPWTVQGARLLKLIEKGGYAADPHPPPSDIPPTPPEVKAFSILESATNMPPSTKTHLASTISRFFAQAADHNLTDPVLRVIYQRLKSHIHARLSASSAAEKVRAASSASQVLGGCGLGEFVQQVGDVVELLEGVRRVDLGAHGRWYEQIAGERREE
ncbi:hypothetical protein B0A48_17408 [Cryoendolithus antarcticus]|uniref:Uncharacterized protein n=1 Tax=Cryoendolithus antarcticus TaxID=1507870 RepID=A0A1V8SCD0_9PEZI|nr:hypothetical protein B0A48_17408 [Cryoendolithus antarcticus]